jgi:hypothetical protein
MIQFKNIYEYYVTYNYISYVLTTQIKWTRYFIEDIETGFNELVKNNILQIKHQISKTDYILDLTNIYVDTNKVSKTKDFFSKLLDEEIYKIMNCNSKEKFKILRYYISLVGTFVKNEKDSENKYASVGYASQDTLGQVANISISSVKRYNKILEDLEILYIYSAKDLIMDTGSNQISAITNTYGRFSDKSKIIQAGREHELNYGFQNNQKLKRIRKLQGDNNRRIAQLYSKFIKGFNYNYEQIKEIYFGVIEINKNTRNKYYTDDLYNQYKKDLEVFSKYDFYDEKLEDTS